LPFRGDSTNSIIHQHIAKRPTPPSELNPDTPQMLERMALKLIEKDPDRRYQSAEGVSRDLERIGAGQADFVLGLDDSSIKLSYRTEFVGREEELEKLERAFDDALQGNGSVFLINGEAGKGKTRLVQELRDFVYSRGAGFIDGKCFSGENKTPYGPLKDALNQYVKDFNGLSEKQKQQTSQRVNEILGGLGEIILRLNPQTRKVIGECPPLAELDADREN